MIHGEPVPSRPVWTFGVDPTEAIKNLMPIGGGSGEDEDEDDPPAPAPRTPRPSNGTPGARYTREDVDSAAANARREESDKQKATIRRRDDEIERLKGIIAKFNEQADAEYKEALESIPEKYREFAPADDADGIQKRDFLVRVRRAMAKDEAEVQRIAQEEAEAEAEAQRQRELEQGPPEPRDRQPFRGMGPSPAPRGQGDDQKISDEDETRHQYTTRRRL